MGVTNYYTVDGQMIGYKDANGRKDFLTDNLGSVTAEIDQTGTNRTFDGRYRPYGNSLWSTGTRGAFGWVGTWGYRGSGLNASTHYVRTRHYSQTNASWTSVDRIWPNQRSFGYVNARPVMYTDPMGLQAGQSGYQSGANIGGTIGGTVSSCQGGQPNDCSNLPKDGVSTCIALLCGIMGGVDIYKAFVGATKVPNNLEGIVKQIKDLWGKDLTDVPGCCKKASQSKGVPINDIIKWIGSGGKKQPKIEDIIHTICDIGAGTKETAWENCVGVATIIRNQGHDNSDADAKKYCESCCAQHYQGPSEEPGLRQCLAQCYKRFLG